MVIHRIKKDETVSDVAKLYGVDEDILRTNNGLDARDRPAVGEELLILTPTRTYVVKGGDSAERLALRFGVLRRELMANNPFIERVGLVAGQRLALRYDEREYGQAATNGYFYSGSDIGTLRERLPLLTYVTLGGASCEGRSLRRIFDFRDAVGIVRMADKIPLLRIFGSGYNQIKEDEYDSLVREMIDMAVSGGFKGIVLGGEPIQDELMLRLRKMSLGCDLILLSELGLGSGEHLSDASDATVFSGTSRSFCPKEFLAELETFAMQRESNRCMPELFCFAENEGKFITVTGALEIARRGGCEIEYDKERGSCTFTHKKSGEYVFPSLYSIKAILDAVHEYGYMGLSFDLSRAPMAYLMMINALFGRRQ